MSELTLEKLKEILVYDPETGIVRWRKTRLGRSVAGRRAGCRAWQGYRKICVLMKRYAEHRLVWFYMTGRWPKDQIDHINRIRNDNRWANLREVTAQENQQNTNREGWAKNKSGFVGIFWSGQRNKWQASFRFKRKQIHVGFFDSIHDARAAYLAKVAKVKGPANV